MKTKKAITLLKSLPKEDCKKLIEARKKRIRNRLDNAGNLGFRIRDDIVKKHGNIKAKINPYYTSSAKCLVCNSIIGNCLCKIEVRDQNNNLIEMIEP